jgi:pyruvate,water dikinase
VIEAAFGLGEVVVGGQIEPDTYVLAKDGLGVLVTHIGTQTHEILSTDDGDRRVELSPENGGRRVLDEGALAALARLGIDVEHCGCPQDIEFAIDDDQRISLVQTRPITTLEADTRRPQEAKSPKARRSACRSTSACS